MLIHPQQPVGSGQFGTTCWTFVLEAKRGDSEGAREALEALCRIYWYPIYAFVRRKGYAADQAQDLTQGFLADLLSRDFLRSIDPSKGKFRVFLMVALRNYLSNQRARRQVAFENNFISIDFDDGERSYRREPGHLETAEQLFERRWALTVLAGALDALEAELVDARKGPLFDRLKRTLASEPEPATYAEIAAKFGMTVQAVKQEAYRTRKRFRELVRAEVGRTIADPADVDREIADLFRAVSR